MRPKGPRKNNFLICAPRCAADLAWAIEGNSRRSLAYVEDFQIEPEPKLWCRWDAKSGSYSCAGPKDAILLRDMIDYARRAQSAVRNRDRSELESDLLLSAALERFVEVIGEAASKTSNAIRQSSPEIRWREIIGMRNRLVHGYASVDHGILWDVVSVDLPELLARLEELADE